MGENRLSQETSEYLLQHKDNPVHWWAWGEDAFKEAQKTGKPVLLSVGYAACHWCHVMAHECFEDEEIAGLMNDLFVNIKLDREERPDIDKLYMSALHHLGEHGGWPLNMFLTPQGEPFWGGTYFPKSPKYGRPGFGSVLKTISEVFQKQPDKIKQNTEALIKRLQARPVFKEGTPPNIPLETVLAKLATIMDEDRGGPRGAPKFPQCTLLDLFWLGYQQTGNKQYLHIVETSLKNMCQGGIYDHLGGGFSRYSVDEIWLVPHFEKMIYDNAQLISLMSKAYLQDQNPLFRIRIEETIEWLVRDMQTQKGPFCASLDADSEGEEGKYYVWQEDEIRDILPRRLFDSFVKIYGVDSNGNWEGKNILNRLGNLELSDDKTEQDLQEARQHLLAAREKRVAPGLDDKILADWNGLLISALCDSAVIFKNDCWLEMAKTAFDFIAGKMCLGKKLAHSYAKKQSKHAAMLDDYAFMISAALVLYEITAHPSYLEQALIWHKALEKEFWDKQQNAYTLSAKNDPLLVANLVSSTDEATPSGNAVMIKNLIRLGSFTGEETYFEQAHIMLGSFLPDMAHNIVSHASVFAAREFADMFGEIFICPHKKSGNHLGLIASVKNRAPFHSIVHLCTDDVGDENHPAFGKVPTKGKDTFYYCRNRTCSEPVNDLTALEALFERPLQNRIDQ